MGAPTNTETSDSGLAEAFRSFLTRCSFDWPRRPFDTAFYELAIQESNRRGVTSTSKGASKYFGPCLRCGVSMATASYEHLENKETIMLICLFVSGTLYIDDVDPSIPEDRQNVEKFTDRFVSGQAQPEPVLTLLAGVLRDMYNHFGRVEANGIVTSGLNLYNSVLLEIRSRELQIEVTEPAYASFYRNMSGATDAFSFFMFPSVPMSDYIQAMPDLAIVLNYTNDILSFYKEEVQGDEVNCVTLLANGRKISKLDAVNVLIDDCVKAHQNIVRILAPSKEASEVYHKWMQGYFGFHVYAERYRLNELGFWA
ncbi:hypothetical protein VKT23_006418 [Stygiomarasmius scandens]|uniref:Terpenoid synthase n=1 Tax=Marasmiellus scandens TaxID=2682957 RepID=A0ABR1JND5_9AGAR